MKILLIDQNYSFTTDIESRMILSDDFETEIITLNNVNETQAKLKMFSPDRIVLNADILQYYPDWDYNIPVTCYARNVDTLKLAAEKGISCYGIVKSASQLIDAIHNNSVITIQPDRSKVENSREKTLSTSRMPSVNSESFRDNRPERVPDNRKDSIAQKKSVLSDDIYTGAVQYEEEDEGEDIIESREPARVKRPSQVQHSEPIARNAENTRYYQEIPASRKTPVMEDDTDDSNQEEDDYTLDLRSRMAKVREQEKIAEQKRKEEEKKKQESMLEKQISQEVGDT